MNCIASLSGPKDPYLDGNPSITRGTPPGVLSVTRRRPSGDRAADTRRQETCGTPAGDCSDARRSPAGRLPENNRLSDSCLTPSDSI